MFSQNLVNYNHKPRNHYFGAEEVSASSEAISADYPVVEQKKPKNCFPDVFVSEFICDQIIQSISFNNDLIYFCFYCNHYIRDLNDVRQHVLTDHHIKMKSSQRYDKGLNKKFVIKSINSKDLEYLSDNEKLEMIHQELDRIPNDQKHFYVRRGIRLMNVIGEYAYYCKICEKPISSFNLIPNHLESDSHQRLENRQSLFNLIRDGKHKSPIIGLQFIIEYKNCSMDELIYKCSFCHIYRNANQMYSHLFDFKHQINVLNNLENTKLETISEEILDFKINEWNKKIGMGFVTRSKETPHINGDNCSSSMEQLRAIFGSFRPKSIETLKRLFSVKIGTEFEAQKVLEMIEAINASVDYYSHKNEHYFKHC